ncbi:MAG: 50S ribosomal protein L9 [bacterium]|nr:50S ribosomal protein L9 [bacterium]
MKVLLNANVENLGRLGDQVEVKPGYARNYLLPKELALLPTKHNLDVMKYKKVKAQKQLEIEKLSAMEQKKKLELLTLTFEKKVGENDTLFGSVTPMEVEKKLDEMGITIERKKFQMEDHIKKTGSYICKIRLVEDIYAEIKLEVVSEAGPAEEEAVTEAAEEEAVTEAAEEEAVTEAAEEVVEDAVEEVVEETEDVTEEVTEEPKTEVAEEE